MRLISCFFMSFMIVRTTVALGFPSAQNVVEGLSSLTTARLITFRTNVSSAAESELVGVSLANEFKKRFAWMKVQKKSVIEDGGIHWWVDLCPCDCNQLSGCKTHEMFPKLTVHAMLHQDSQGEGCPVYVSEILGRYASIDWGATCSNYVGYVCVATNEVAMGHFFENNLKSVVKSRGMNFARLKRTIGPLAYLRARVHPSNGNLCDPGFYFVDSEKKWIDNKELLRDVNFVYDALSRSEHASVDMTILYDSTDFNISVEVVPGDGKITKKSGRPYTMGVL